MTKDGDFASMMEAATRGGLDRTARRLERGQEVEGTIVQIGSDAVFVDIGLPADARLERSDLTAADGTFTARVGDRVRAKVVSPNHDQPRLAVAMGKSGAALDTSAFLLARDSGTPVEGTVAAVIKGGMEVAVGGVRAFCPASQADATYVEDLGVYVGQTFQFLVLEVRDGGKSIVLSRKRLLEQERLARAEALKAELAPGDEREAVVVNIKPHGAVLDLGGLEAYVHISELAPHRVRSVAEVLQVGETVRARVVSVEDGERGPRVRMSLVLDTAGPPADDSTQPAREVLEATVRSANSGGLVVSTSRGEGFVPVRELELAPGADHRRAFPEGTTLRIVAIGPGTGGRLRMSAKQVTEVVERANFQEFSRGEGASRNPRSLGSLGDLLRAKLGGLTAMPSSPGADVGAAAPGASRGASGAHGEGPKAPSQSPEKPKRHTGVLRRRKP